MGRFILLSKHRLSVPAASRGLRPLLPPIRENATILQILRLSKMRTDDMTENNRLRERQFSLYLTANEMSMLECLAYEMHTTRAEFVQQMILLGGFNKPKIKVNQEEIRQLLQNIEKLSCEILYDFHNADFLNDRTERIIKIWQKINSILFDFWQKHYFQKEQSESWENTHETRILYKVRLTDEEYSMLNEKADKWKMTKNEFLRQMIVYREIQKNKPLISEKMQENFLRDMDKIGDSIEKCLYQIRLVGGMKYELVVRGIRNDYKWDYEYVYCILMGG